MKKYFFISELIFLIFLFAPYSLVAGKLSVKMSFGLAAGGRVDDVLLVEPAYSKFVSMGGKEKSSLGQGYYLEFIYELNPYLSLSIGNSYTSKMFKGREAEYSPSWIRNLGGSYFLKPEFSAEIIPIWISAMFSPPLGSGFRVNFAAGVGYYWGHFESKSEWKSNLPGFFTWRYRSWNFKGHGHCLGFQLGGGFDLALSFNLYLSCEAVYRIINFNDVKSSAELGTDSTFSYFQFYETDKISADFDYRVNKVSLSGLSLQAGLKFKF